jgi:hypothetical protein
MRSEAAAKRVCASALPAPGSGCASTALSIRAQHAQHDVDIARTGAEL